jgi:integrase
VKTPTSARRPIRILTVEEVEALADAFDPRYRGLVLLGAYGGLRFGEASALRVKHLALLERRVQVEEGSSEVNGKLYVGPLKTRESRRAVTIPAFLADELGRQTALIREHALGQHLKRRVLDVADLVFPAPEGGYLRRTSFGRRYWAPAVVRAGIDPAPTFHHLRHTCAALMIAEGAHPKAIMARMGHASITTTFNTYGHLLPSLDVELADRLDERRAEARAAYLRRGDDRAVVEIKPSRR